MRRLLLLRHAKAEHDASTGRDRDRALSERGRDDARAMGSYIGAQNLGPSRVWLSPAVRVQQTWAAASPMLDHGTVETIEQIYGADSGELLDLLRGAPDDATALLVCGHNPTMHEVALMLVGDGHHEGRQALGANFPTCALCVIDFDVDEWSDIAVRAGRLDRFMSPRLLCEGKA